MDREQRATVSVFGSVQESDVQTTSSPLQHTYPLLLPSVRLGFRQNAFPSQPIMGFVKNQIHVGAGPKHPLLIKP